MFSERRLANTHRKAVKAPTTPSADEPVLAVVEDVQPTQSIDEVLPTEKLDISEETEQKFQEALSEAVVESVVEEEESLDLGSLTKKQLIEVAKKEKVTYKNLTKAELVEALSIVLG